MDAISSTNKPSTGYLDPDRSDRASGKPILPTPAVTDDTIGPSLVDQPQARVFTLFMRLPAELRVIIWEFACAPPGARIHFLEPMADTETESRGPFWYDHRRWQKNYGPGCESTPRIHWEISERTNDPCFQWSGRELLSVCREARRAFLGQGTTSHREQLRGGFSDMDHTTDVICIRAGYASSGYFDTSFLDAIGERETGFCHPDERPSPRRLALEIPVSADYTDLGGRARQVMPQWLNHYGRKQKFMRLDRLETVYLLDQHIKPWAHYHHQEDMPHEMYTESFDGHHGSKFVAIDPEDKQAVQLWSIPDYCPKILTCFRIFPHFTYMTISSDADADYSRSIRTFGLLPRVKMRFLACVRESSQTQQLDDVSPNSGFAFT